MPSAYPIIGGTEMLYTTVNICGKELKLRLTNQNCVMLEKKLGKNPIAVLAIDPETGIVPMTSEIVAILHASLQALEHGYNEQAVYRLIDEYIDEGHTINELYPVVVEIFRVSGLLPKAAEDEEDEKNG